MKKSILLGAVLVCGLTLAGCGNANKSASSKHETKTVKVTKKVKHSSSQKGNSSDSSSVSGISSSADQQSTTETSQANNQQASQQPAQSNNDSSSSNGSDSVYTDDQGAVHHIHMTGQQYMGSNLGTDEVTSPDGSTHYFEHDTPAN